MYRLRTVRAAAQAGPAVAVPGPRFWAAHKALASALNPQLQQAL